MCLWMMLIRLQNARINYTRITNLQIRILSAGFLRLCRKSNYPFENRRIQSLIYSSNFHNESFVFFIDARIKSIDGGVVTIQDKYLDPVVFSSQTEFESKSVDDVRSISFILENFKDAGAAIRSGESSSKDLTGCLLFLGKDYCNGFIDIDYSSTLSRFGEFQKVLNVRGGEVFDLNYYKAESGTVPLLVDVHASPENPVKVLFEGKELIVSGNTQIDVSSTIFCFWYGFCFAQW
jgi:hypothetical protein